MNKIFAPFLPPWAETGLQPAFYDVESGTVLQQTARMYDKVNQLTRLFNELSEETATTVNDYISRFTELYDYVHDYFDNLDVQEEINNKLDAMADDGTLQEIIATYVQSNVAWTFDSIAEMDEATNLTADSYAQTLGYYSVNDGGGAIYYITDVEPSGYYVTLTSGLYAKPATQSGCINVKQVGAYGDDTHDDATAIQTALDNYTDIFFPSGTYYIGTTLTVGSCNIHGVRGQSIITTHSDMIAMQNGDSDIDGLYLHDIDFLGNVEEVADSYYPKRNVTYVEPSYGNGMATALYLRGSNSKRYTVTTEIKNIKIYNCNFNNIYSLPVVIEGCFNVEFDGNNTNNCLDIGFIDNEKLDVTNNIVTKSADNGISISSGNNNVTCSNNIVNLSAYNGIWLSGWNVEVTIEGNTGYKLYYGPTNVVCTNNIIKNSGHAGIVAKWKVDNLLIADNIIDTCLLNCKDDNTDNNDGGRGIHVAGYGGSNIDDEGHTITLTVCSYNVTIKNNRLSNCKRGAISLDRVQNSDVQGNSVLNVGSLTKQSGTTITSSDYDYNYFFYIHNHASCNGDAVVYDNTYRDDRDDIGINTYLTHKFYVEKAPNMFIMRNSFYAYNNAPATVTNSSNVHIEETKYEQYPTTYITIDNSKSTISAIYNYLETLGLDMTPVTMICPANVMSALSHGLSTTAGWGTIRATADHIYDYTAYVPYTGMTYEGRINTGSHASLYKVEGTYVSLS